MSAWAIVAYATITVRNGHDPARLGTDQPAPEKRPLPVEGRSRCRNQWQRIRLPLCSVPAHPQIHQMW